MYCVSTFILELAFYKLSDTNISSIYNSDDVEPRCKGTDTDGLIARYIAMCDFATVKIKNDVFRAIFLRRIYCNNIGCRIGI